MKILTFLRYLKNTQKSQCLCSVTNFARYRNANITNKIETRFYSDDCPALKCKVAIVTGGARGIGFHIADRILCAGAKNVIIGDVLVEDCKAATCKLNSKYGENKALFQQVDVTKQEEMEKIFKDTKEKIGQIDIVVNNAGILADNKWQDTIAINAAGAVRGTLLAFQHMGVNNGGKGGIVINVASILGLQPLFSSPVYVGTKHFLIGFTRSMGSDYFCKMTSVKVMAICPGVTDTVLITDSSKGGLPGFGDLGKELACSLGALPPQGPEEVGKGIITMIKDDDNGSIWVSEACDVYKVNLPDRNTFKPPGAGKGCPPKDPCKTDGCGAKQDPCAPDPCKPDPCKKESSCGSPKPCSGQDPFDPTKK